MKIYKNEQVRRIIKNCNPHWALSYLKQYRNSKYQLELMSVILVGTSATAIYGLVQLDLIPNSIIKRRLHQLGDFL